MGVDEEGTLAALRQHRSELIDPEIAAHGGRIVKTMGDGLLLEFASVVEAVQCSVNIQNGMAERNSPIPDGQRIVFRIGINLCDVIVDGEDILGDGVNIAARLEGLAEPGGICLSADAHRQVRARGDLAFDDMGEIAVKNIAEPVHVYRIVLDNEPAAATPGGSTAAALERPAIAVLPFINMSGDEEQEYFADGLTEDLITALSVWRSFPVIARNSTFAYKGTSPDIRKVAEELGARYVLEGSVRKAGQRVRITGQLIDAATGHHIWAEKYDRELADIFDLQDEISRQIVATIEPEVARAEQQRSWQKKPLNLDAWDYCQRGMARLAEFTRNGNEEARAMFDLALAADGTYGQALAGVSLSHTRDLLLEYSDDRDASGRLCLEAAQAAVASDPDDFFAHLVLAVSYMWPARFDHATAAAERALALNPSSAFAHGILGTALDNDGRSHEGTSEIELALKLSPRNPQNHIFINTLARAHLNGRNYDKAAHWAGEAIRLKPDFPHAYYILASALGHQGRLAEAIEAVAACECLQPGFLARRQNWQPYRDPSDNEHIHAGVRLAEGDGSEDSPG